MFNKFRNQFQIQYPFSNTPFFDDFFFQDTLLKYDFYKKGFFLERFKRDMYNMGKLFIEMDFTKNNFFEKQFPLNELPEKNHRNTTKNN